MSRSLQAAFCLLEVERKFLPLAVQDLITQHGNPPFRSIRALGRQTIHNVYYDRSSLLSSAGVWVRLRNGLWEAKVKRGGNYNNSRFEEFSDPQAISQKIAGIIGVPRTQQERFGLKPVTSLSTIRRSWVADDEFKIVVDTTDFGHTVGEQKQRTMQEMDDRIARFMERYSWAFRTGVPKGKLTAYFERDSPVS
ncbi:hypothetical protein CC78DRAFT_554126 [Lojkania enalia]|uniref:Thiamine-triphosphatase n=1 Tax=Lojkania enalia TaxID=147567 RepID=A0A9P4K611_9PLEO|nr:hypothetical protein CC78DRAFT_554126 [Didymosphaeria enalia]